MNYRIDPEFKSALPPLRTEERAALKARISAEGCKPGSLIVGDIAGEFVLLDGHNTVEVCGELGAEPCQPIVRKFASRLEALKWIADNQVARRNATDEWFAYLIGSEYLEAKQAHGGIERTTSSPQVATLATCGKAAKNVANAHGVSERTVHNNAAFAEAVDSIGETEGPEAKKAILDGTAGATKREVIETAKAGGKVLCAHCTTLVRKGLPAERGCADCKAARAPARETTNGTPAREPGDDEMETPDQEMQRINGTIESFCRQLSKFAIDNCPSDYWLTDLGRRDGALRKVKDACETLRTGKCAGLCPRCEGEGRNCRTCHGTGRLPKMLLDACN